VHARNLDTVARDATINGTVAGVSLRRTIHLAPGQAQTVSFMPKTDPGLDLSHPKIWWPLGMGDHPLYSLQMTVAVDGRESDRAATTFGVRSVSSRLTKQGYRQFLVNGKPVLIRGGGWAPDMFLRDDPARTREIYGRHGTDFIGIALSDDGEVARVIAGEAKWRQTLNNSTIASLLHGPRVEDEETGEMVRSGRGIWFEVNRDTGIPHGLRQLQRLLEHRDPDGHANAIFSIDRAVLANAAIDRTNLVVIVGNGARRRDAGECAIDWEERPQEYRSRHDLQVVEVILENGADLVDALYASLWDQG